MSRSSKKGPLVEERLMARIEAHERRQQEADGQDLVADVDDLPRDGRAHDRRPRRPQARARLRHRSRWSATSSASSRRRAPTAATPTPGRSDEPSPKTQEARRGDEADAPAETAADAEEPSEDPIAEADEQPRRGRSTRPRSRPPTPRTPRPPRTSRPPPRPRRRGRGRAAAARRARPRRPRPPRGARRGAQRASPASSSARTPSTSAPPPARRAWSATTSAASPSTRRARSSRTRRARSPSDWSKLLESAVANAEHNHELLGDDLTIVAVTADEGPTLKRFRPRAMGRATRDPQAHRAPLDHARRRRSSSMGQKVHPESMRVGYIHDWKSNWFTERDFATTWPRTSTSATTSSASSRTPACRDITIRKDANEVEVNIHTARPGHRDRQVRLARSTPCARTCTASPRSRSRSTSSRSSAPSSTPSSSRSRSPSSCRTAWPSAAR